MKKLVLVTGATRGLGLEVTRRLLLGGYKVIGSGRKITTPVTELLQQYPDDFHFESLDLNDVGAIKGFCASIIKSHGRFYGLVNNAALGHDGVLGTMHETEISECIRVNIEAPILLTKYISRSMLINRTGRVVNISSIIATTGFSGLSVYAATKASMTGFTKSLSRELGKGGITVNCVAPGYITTDMTSELQGRKLDTIVRRSPMNRLVEPRDVAGAVEFLLGDDAMYITGTTLTIDAGSTA